MVSGSVSRALAQPHFTDEHTEARGPVERRLEARPGTPGGARTGVGQKPGHVPIGGQSRRLPRLGLRPQAAHPLTGAADRGLDSRLLQHRHPVDGALDVLGEHVPVQVEEAESELV